MDNGKSVHRLDAEVAPHLEVRGRFDRRRGEVRQGDDLTREDLPERPGEVLACVEVFRNSRIVRNAVVVGHPEHTGLVRGQLPQHRDVETETLTDLALRLLDLAIDREGSRLTKRDERSASIDSKRSRSSRVELLTVDSGVTPAFPHNRAGGNPTVLYEGAPFAARDLKVELQGFERRPE